MPIEVKRKEQSNNVVDKLELLGSCLPASQLCSIVRNVQSILSKEELVYWCTRISSMCHRIGTVRDEECTRSGFWCMKAVEALTKGDEKEYIRCCEKTKSICPQLYNPFKPKSTRKDNVVTMYE